MSWTWVIYSSTRLAHKLALYIYEEYFKDIIGSNYGFLLFLFMLSTLVLLRFCIFIFGCLYKQVHDFDTRKQATISSLDKH